MGREARERPKRLGEKLLNIRTMLDLSQDGLLRRLSLENRLSRDDISKYERGVREPSLITLMRYAQIAGVCVDVLINDELELPSRLPGYPRHKVIRGK